VHLEMKISFFFFRGFGDTGRRCACLEMLDEIDVQDLWQVLRDTFVPYMLKTSGLILQLRKRTKSNSTIPASRLLMIGEHIVLAHGLLVGVAVEQTQFRSVHVAATRCLDPCF
jgi:hypothetical protein